MVEPIRFYFDQHINPRIAKGLSRHGIDVLTAQDEMRCGFADTDQLEFAATV